MRNIIIGFCFAMALVGIIVIKTDHRHDTANAAPVDDGVIAQYRAECTSGGASANCAVLRAGVVAQTIQAIQDLADLHDSEAQQQALAALAVDEPQLQLFAAQLLRSTANRDTAAAALPLLLGPHPALQHAAAEMMANGDTPQREIAERWKQGHPKTTRNPHDVMPAIPAVAAKFTAYPNAERYAPGDGPQSIGWRTPDALDKVVAVYAKTGKPIDAKAWKSAPASPMEADMKELQALALEFQKTHDMKLMQRIQELTQKVQTGVKTQAATGGNSTTVSARKLPQGEAGKTFVGFVVEGDVSNPIRAVAIYREESIKMTVIEMVWDGSKYPVW